MHKILRRDGIPMRSVSRAVIIVYALWSVISSGGTVARRTLSPNVGFGPADFSHRVEWVPHRGCAEENAIMDEGRISTSARSLYSRLGAEIAPVVVDVR